jgi:hypothetical protein
MLLCHVHNHACFIFWKGKLCFFILMFIIYTHLYGYVKKVTSYEIVNMLVNLVVFFVPAKNFHPLAAQC